MAFATYLGHIDARVREALAPELTLTWQWEGESSARWSANERFVVARQLGTGEVQFVLYVASEAFPYDRFADDLQVPDLISTARKVSDFFNATDIDAPA